ncbi:MAG: hypothetical protein KA712_24990 [Myxococcales bacterium]|nr:hypothetical protein [Myxococcales bacterium]
MPRFRDGGSAVLRAAGFAVLAWALGACSSDFETERASLGAACESAADCPSFAPTCLPFKGGYCGLTPCGKDSDCPVTAACVTHSDGVNYCFLGCFGTSDCNRARPAEVAATCSERAEFVQAQQLGRRACVPPDLD